ncbi:hypothetical protein D9756_008925 [Leucocoprinus leucothites]|uniref:RING-type domain-containing protein n=1 Tax=Leucocoprinus leucothites TaxID=201217 RepID=A0A8H5CX17_9AGAR|nr:hypothetical protein D9756_008925 [Leucoagaricus leucothites]
MSELLCTICHQSNTYDKFLAQHCGHVFCGDCTTQISRRERKCPTCRREWGSRSPFRLYLNFPDPDKSTRVFHHLESIDKDSSAILVEKTSGIIRDLAEDPDIPMTHDAATLLLDAALRLEERVSPLASELGYVRQENEALRQQLKDLNAQLKSKDALVSDLDRLNQTVMEREVAISLVRDELAHEKQKRQSEHDTNRRLTRSLRKKQEEIKTKENEIDSLKSGIVERDKQLGLMKSKLRALVKLTKPPKTPVQNPDDSLIVERPQPFSEIENSGNEKNSLNSASASSGPLSGLLSLSKRKKADL